MSRRFLLIAIALAFTALVFAVKPSSATTSSCDTAKFSTSAAQQAFLTTGDLSQKTPDNVQAERLLAGGRGPISARSYGCSNGCSYGCSIGCTNGCSYGCRRW